MNLSPEQTLQVVLISKASTSKRGMPGFTKDCLKASFIVFRQLVSQSDHTDGNSPRAFLEVVHSTFIHNDNFLCASNKCRNRKKKHGQVVNFFPYTL